MKSFLTVIMTVFLGVAAVLLTGWYMASHDPIAEAHATAQAIVLREKLEQQRLSFELYELNLNRYEREHGLKARLDRESEDQRHPERMPWHQIERGERPVSMYDDAATLPHKARRERATK
jgi:hypothetical protein